MIQAIDPLDHRAGLDSQLGSARTAASLSDGRTSTPLTLSMRSPLQVVYRMNSPMRALTPGRPLGEVEVARAQIDRMTRESARTSSRSPMASGRNAVAGPSDALCLKERSGDRRTASQCLWRSLSKLQHEVVGPPTAAYLALSCSPSAYVGGRVQTPFGQFQMGLAFPYDIRPNAVTENRTVGSSIPPLGAISSSKNVVRSQSSH